MNMITRCPACETSFRITEAQLSTAKGAVRCGSCLHIFKALENLIPPRTESKPAAARKNTADAPRFEYRRPAALRSSVAKPHTELTGDKRDGSSPLGLPSTPASATVTQAAKESPLTRDYRPIEDSSDLAIAPDSWQEDPGKASASAEEGESRLLFDQAAIDKDDIEADGLFADDLLISDEMAMEDEEENVRSSADFGDENFISLDNWKSADKPLFDRGPRAPKEVDEDEDFDMDESWAMDLLEEEEGKPAPASPPAPGLPRDSFRDLGMVSDDAGDEDNADIYSPDSTDTFSVEEDESLVDDEFSRQSTLGDAPSFVWRDEALDEDESSQHDHSGYEPLRVDASDRRALLSRIEPEPVEFAIVQGRDWRRTLLWGALSAVGLLLLLTQVAWLQFDRLSRQQPYRDFYAAICPLAGCELPSLSAPGMIRTSNLVVRSHPQAEGALMVDTILLNRASFQQPFPDLVLTFSNIHGETLAARRFTPSEYLAGEVAGRTSMPSNQPIHLSLEIVDPGPEAVNYSAYIPQ